MPNVLMEAPPAVIPMTAEVCSGPDHRGHYIIILLRHHPLPPTTTNHRYLTPPGYSPTAGIAPVNPRKRFRKSCWTP